MHSSDTQICMHHIRYTYLLFLIFEDTRRKIKYKINILVALIRFTPTSPQAAPTNWNFSIRILNKATAKTVDIILLSIVSLVYPNAIII